MSPARSRRWIEQLRAPLSPALRAYGGLRVRDCGTPRTADVLGRLGDEDVRVRKGTGDLTDDLHGRTLAQVLDVRLEREPEARDRRRVEAAP